MIGLMVKIKIFISRKSYDIMNLIIVSVLYRLLLYNFFDLEVCYNGFYENSLHNRPDFFGT